MVVGVHTLGYCIPLEGNQKAIISFVVHAVSVPVFFLADGYLFARKIVFSGNYDYVSEVKKSAFRLLVPWVIFTLLYSIARYGFELLGFFKENLIIGRPFHAVMIAAYGSVVAPQMYFLLSLFLIRLCGPLFGALAKIRNFLLLFSCYIVYLAVHVSSISTVARYLRIEGGQEPILHALWGVQFYFLGMVIFRVSRIIDPKKLLIPSLILLMTALLFKNSNGRSLQIFTQYSYLITLTFACMWMEKRIFIFDFIGRNTMGIYLLHAPVVMKVVSLFFNQFISNPISSFFTILFGTLFLTLFIVIGLNQLPLGPVLFGQSRK